MDFDIEALKRADPSAWSSFLTHFKPLIRSVVLWSKWRFAGHTADDLVQDVGTELMRAIVTFKGDASLEYFVKRVCIHRCVDEVRRQIRQRQSTVSLHDESLDSWDPPAGDEFDPLRAIAVSERAQAMKRLVGTLDDTCEQAIRFFYLDGLTYNEISAKLGIAVNTVGSRLAKCLGKLRGLAGQDAFFREEYPPVERQTEGSSP